MLIREQAALYWALSEKISAIQFPGKIINDHKQVLVRITSKLPFQPSELFGIKVDEFSRVRFVIAFGFTLERLLD